jgi:acid ceramidase
MNEQIINLDLPASKRWAFLADHVEGIDSLLDCYLKDFEEAKYLFEGIGYYKKEIIPPCYQEEISFIASISRFDEDRVLIANLYYDVLKFYFGCTAFAVDNGTTTFHCRNLDWHTENNLLGKHSMIFDFQRGGHTLYKTVGWPGFVGALSGIRPGKFSVTLNAVLSNDKPEIAFPISFLIRDVLASAESYDEAKYRLEQTPIASDCLILLSGVKPNEKAVIERTPKRFATRETSREFIAVTNDYKKLENGKSGSQLQVTSCSRYDSAIALLNKQIPDTKGQCLNILMDEDVMLGITVQQMVFDNKTGEIALIAK